MQTVITNTNYSKTISLLKSEYDKLSDDGCFFALIKTEYDAKGNVINDFFDVISVAIKVGYHYVNTIVYPTSEVQECSFIDNVKYVVWLCKNHSKMKFCKDSIREKHIWKDVEWGKRTKNYNPKGKDPGNVWIPTEDDGNANITNHIMLNDQGVIERIISMSGCNDDYALFKDGDSVDVKAIEVSQSNIDICNKISHSKVIFKSSENMKDIAGESIKLIVTSPPYWDLKDYFKEGQIGQESYSKYLQRMKKVWKQCYNKLSTDGSLWVNINTRVQDGKVIPIPRDFVLMCKEIGFNYKGIIIWHKSSGIPTSDKNIVDRHEYVLVFSKSEQYRVNKTVFSTYADYKNDKINGGAFWNINRKAGSVGKKYIHPAIYPNELVERIIKISTHEGEAVLDPFLGSGTSIIAAEKTKRVCIGYEYNEGFEDLICSRFSLEIPEAKVKFIKP